MAPSERHVALQNKALAWLAARVTGRGLRGGVEIPLGPQYVADAVAVCDFQFRYDMGYYGTRIAEFLTSSACVFEAKASLADLQSTFGGRENAHRNRHDPVGTLHWIVIPRGMSHVWSVSLGNVPEFWGILEESGSGLRETKSPLACPISAERYNALCAAILWYQ